MKYPELLNEDVARVGVQVARKYNIQAGILLTDVIKTSLGPRGLDKVYIDIQGDTTITKHGGAFLRKIDVDHPAAKAIIEGANAVDTNVGDGTITVAILIGALLKKANELLDNGIPPAIITRGYEKGSEFALEILSNITQKSDSTNRSVMHDLAISCLKGKALFNMSSDDIPIASMIIDAICTITNFTKNQIDVDNIKIEEKPGNVSDIELIKGVVIDKTIDNYAMPQSIENAKILLTNENLETFRTKTESEIIVNSPEQMSLFLNQESNDIIAKVRKIIDSGANVVISRKGIDSLAQECLAKAG
ncbi:MAG: TCP-1/cpn60 chaperonin family protein, partial [Nitrosopumilaceae archaeon]